MVQIYPCMSFASSSEILLALVLNKVHHDFLAQLEWLSPMTLRGENTLPATRYYNFFFSPNKLKNFAKEGKQLNNLSPKHENHPSTDAWGFGVICGVC